MIRINSFLSHRITKLHEAGMIERKPERNPLNAEKSPRVNFNGFDFNPPKPREEKPRWVYPESDWGLMAKFNSQKQIYSAIYERERSQKQIEQEINQLREKNLKLIENEIQKRKEHIEKERLEQEEREREYKKMEDMIANPHKYAHMQNYMSAHKENGINPKSDFELQEAIAKDLRDPKDRSGAHTPKVFKPLDMSNSLFNKYGKSSRNHELLDKFLPTTDDLPKGKVNSTELKSTLKKSRKNLELFEKNLFNTYQTLSEVPVTNIRALEKDHPEVLAKFRAERAAEFVAKRGKSALEPPAPRNDLGTVAFRPGGILPATTTKHDEQNRSTKLNKSISSSSNGMEASLNLPVELLSQQLKKTEDEIAFQKVKIGLNSKKPKHYELK
jgi:hypothetical protein